MSGNNYCVYMHTFPNGKIYIGITSQSPERRWKKGNGYSNNQNAMSSAIKKYGWDNIKHEILFDNLNEDEACKAEIDLISKYKSNTKQYGYNISNGGKGSFSISDSTREKMRANNLGKKLSQETKKRIGNGNKKHWQEHKKTMPKEAYIKIWESRRKNNTDIPWNKGIRLERKIVSQYSKDGKFIKTYSSAEDAGLSINTSASHIFECCNGKRKSAGGYMWRYTEYQE